MILWSLLAAPGVAQGQLDSRQATPSAEKLIAAEGSIGGANWQAASANSYGAQQLVGDDQLARGLADAAPKKELDRGVRISAEKHHRGASWVAPMIWTLAGLGSLLVLSAAAVLLWRLATRAQAEREPPPMIYDLPRI
jgi:hypothetical protein